MSTTGQTYYKAARDELVMRIRLREQVLNYFIVAAGAVIGVAISDVNGMGNTIALIIPFMALGTSIILTSHTMVITNIARYTRHLYPAINLCREKNLKRIIASFDESTPEEEINTILEETDLKPWDWSGSYMQTGLWSSWQRLVGNMIVLLAPVCFSLYLGLLQFEQIETQRKSIATVQKQASSEYINRFKMLAKTGSEADILNLQFKPEYTTTLEYFEDRAKIHSVLFSISCFLTLFIIIILGYGHWHRKRWIDDNTQHSEPLTSASS